MNFSLGSVVIDNFNLTRFPLVPDEADPPLPVDADAVPTAAIAFERFETVGRRRPQIIQNFGAMELQQFAEGGALDVPGQPARSLAFPDLLRLLAAETMDHRDKV
jgi:hypothetical protein